METFILAIHIILAFGLTFLVLIQKSDGGALGSLGGQGASSFLTGRQVGNALTKITGFFFAAFVITSLTLVVLSKKTANEVRTLSDVLPVEHTVNK